MKNLSERRNTFARRLVEEIHHAGQHDASHPAGNAHHDKAFSIGEDGLFKEDAGGLFKAWHKTNARVAGDGLADPNGREYAKKVSHRHADSSLI